MLCLHVGAAYKMGCTCCVVLHQVCVTGLTCSWSGIVNRSPVERKKCWGTGGLLLLLLLLVTTIALPIGRPLLNAML